jgi:short subunit dehydrogenase-like uncharacterized protein
MVMEQDGASDEVWILGATGRSGRAVAERLAAATDVAPVLVGRDGARLDEVAKTIGGGIRTVAADSVGAMAALIQRERPIVVINTIGPFTETAQPIARAGLSGSHYVDLANDLESLFGLLGLHEAAVAAGRTLVTGAGFGVLATESVVMTLCEGHPTPSHVRVDALPSVDTETGVVGEALAATLIDGLAAGGRRYEHGRLVPARLGSEVQHLTLPDGTAVTTSAVPTGDLHAARIVSGAPSVTAGSGLLPGTPAVRTVLPVASAALSIGPLRTFATRLLARTRTKARPRDREHSFGHARITWPDGTSREGWLRVGEAMAFTANVAAEAAIRLARGDERPGAYTPAAVFGPGLATAAGGEFVID